VSGEKTIIWNSTYSEFTHWVISLNPSKSRVEPMKPQLVLLGYLAPVPAGPGLPEAAGWPPGGSGPGGAWPRPYPYMERCLSDVVISVCIYGKGTGYYQ